MLIKQNSVAVFGAWVGIFNGVGSVGFTTCNVLNISKAGGAFAPAAGTLTAGASGFYVVSLAAGDTDTIGDLTVQLTDGGTNIFGVGNHQIVGFNPAAATWAVPGAQMDLVNAPNATA